MPKNLYTLNIFEPNNASDFQLLVQGYVVKKLNTGQILASLYQRWKEALINHLRGDCIVAIIDGKNKTLSLLNSSFSRKSIYFTQKNNLIYFSSNFQQFITHGFCQELDRDALLQEFTLNNANSDHTCYKNIRKIPPGHQYTFRQNKLIITKATTPTPQLIQFNPNNSEEIYQQLQTHINQAVIDCTQQQPFCTQLSGGLDSSTVSLIAAKHCKPQPLSCLTTMPSTRLKFINKKNRNINDSNLVKAVVKQAGNIDLTNLYCHLPYFDIVSLGLFASHFSPTPAAAPLNTTWIASHFAYAKNNNKKIILTGKQGNFTFSYSGRCNNHIKNIARYCRDKLQRRHYCLSDLFLINLTNVSEHHIDLPLIQQNKNKSIQDFYYHAKPHLTPYPDIIAAMEHYFDIFSYDPTAHPDIVKLCLSLENRFYQRDGMSRRLARDGLKGILPDIVRLNTSRGEQCSSWFYQLQQAAPYYLQLMRAFKDNDIIRYIIDVDEMEKLTQELIHYNPFNHDPTLTQMKFRLRLSRALHFAHWIYLHDNPEPWEPTLAAKQREVDLEAV